MKPRSELWVRPPDDVELVITSAVLFRDRESETVRLYARGELAGELRMNSGDGAAMLRRLGLQARG